MSSLRGDLAVCYSCLTPLCYSTILQAGPRSAVGRAPKSEVLVSIPGLATYFRFSFR